MDKITTTIKREWLREIAAGRNRLSIVKSSRTGPVVCQGLRPLSTSVSSMECSRMRLR
jgi:hypothetical protein